MKKENRLIHEYMGRKWIEKPNYFNPAYEQDWNEIMPVVEKIIKHEYEDGDTAYFRTFGMSTFDENVIVRINRHQMFKGESLILTLHRAIVDFIELQKADLANKSHKA